jgi:hypothetical protein
MDRMPSPLTSLSLRIQHPTLDLIPVCLNLGLTPKIIWRAGEDRVTPKGNPIGGTRDQSYCSVEFFRLSSKETSDQILEVLKELGKHQAAIRNISSSGGRVSLYLGIFSSADFAWVLPGDIITPLGQMKIEIDVNVYIEPETFDDSKNDNFEEPS